MCGIAGIVNTAASFSAEALVSMVKDMTDQMIHRGPDDSGVWVAPGKVCAFGQRRLSIIDLSPAGHQPMISSDGKAVITFNGEIYNYLELRAELKAQGVQFRTQTDTEVLLESLRTWGDAAFQKFDGMYAFALFDETTKEILIGRDPFGEKPLYYTQTTDYFAFASELHCLTKLPHFDFSVDDSAVAELLMLQYIHAPRTMYRGVKKLPPGHFMRIAPDGKVTITQHFSFRPQLPPYSNRSISDLADELQEILIRSIKRRMISDVPLGAFLSGGVDSSLVVALMAKELGRDVQTFSIGFAGDKDSEHEFARATAKHLGTNHHEKILAPDVMKLVEHIAHVLDEPNADSSCLPVYLLSEFAREKVTVAISGDGGDELFGGYGRYFATLDEATKKQSGDPNLAHWTAGETYFGPRICVFSLAQAQRVMRSVPGEAQELIQSFKNAIDHSELPLLHRMREIDARTYMPGAVLAKVDRMSMQHALEVRTPFLSVEVARFAEKLSPEQCYQDGNGKLVLKELLCRYLPREFVYRPKQGFGLPTGIWGKESLLPAARKACDTPAARSQYWLPRARMKRFLSEQEQNFSTYQVWNVLMLETWLRAHRAEGVISDIPGSRVSSFEQALLPYRENLPLLDVLSAAEKREGVFIDVEPPPSYLSGFFSKLHYLKLPVESDGSLSYQELYQSLSSISASTILFASGFRDDDIYLMRGLRQRGCKHVFYLTEDGWKDTALTPALHSPVSWPFLRATRVVISKAQRLYRRTRMAVARRVLSRFAVDLFPISLAVRPDEGFAWQAQVPQFSGWSNDVGLVQSDLLLFEDETLLVKDSAHADVRKGGEGRYVHWGDSVYFSTTDNSSPLENGRKYRIIHKPKKTKLLRSFYITPERLFHSVLGPKDFLATCLKDFRFTVSTYHPFRLLESRKLLVDASSKKKLEFFVKDIKRNRPHGDLKGLAERQGIVLFTSHLGPGGAERQLCYLATHLKTRGYKIGVVTQAQPVGQLGHYAPMLLDADVPVESLCDSLKGLDPSALLRPESLSEISSLLALPSDFMDQVQSLYVTLVRLRPQVIHCFLDTANIIGAVAGYLAGVPKIIMSARNVNPTHFEYLNLQWLLPWYRALVTIPSVHLTANSRVGRDSYADWIGISKDRVAVIPNAMDLPRYLLSEAGATKEARAELGIDPGIPVVLGVFRLSPEKRPLLFLRVMSRVKEKIPQLRVVIAGIGPMMDEVQTEIKRAGMDQYVNVLGRRDDIPALIKMCDALSLFSENEGSPNVVLEAQALGKPVVCTAVGGTPEIVLDGVTGFLVPRDDEVEMASRVVELLSSKSLRQRMGVEAARRIEQEFSINKLVEQSLSVYGSGLSAPLDSLSEAVKRDRFKAVNT
jgi:asparagine synthase (glutamine-hydrolysing)